MLQQFVSNVQSTLQSQQSRNACIIQRALTCSKMIDGELINYCNKIHFMIMCMCSHIADTGRE